VLHHAFLTDTSFAEPMHNLTDSYPPSFSWLLTYTPLHLFWAGPEAVIVFFILSGFVLVRLTRRSSFRWRSYYPSRMMRLYLPLWVALLIAVGIEEMAVPSLQHGWNWWLRAHALINASPGSLLRNAIVYEPQSWLLTPLWSLKWEIFFSLLLPLTLLLGGRWRLLAVGQLLVVFGAIALGARTHDDALIYLPMFLVGGLMAQHEVMLKRTAHTLGILAWLLVAGAAAFLITCSWTFHQPTNPSFIPLETGGAALVVVLFAFCPFATRVGERSSVQWLGRIAFSLYLIHEPIIVATAFALPQSARNVWLPLLIALPIVFAASWLFYRLVEGPSHRISQRLARGRRAGPALPAPVLTR